MIGSLALFSGCDSGGAVDVLCDTGSSSDSGIEYESAGAPRPVAILIGSTGPSEVGVYSVPDPGEASYQLTDELLPDPFVNEAIEGKATQSEVTPACIRGTFSFTTGNGATVSNGCFDAAR